MGWLATWRMVLEGLSWSGYERNCVFLNTGGPRFADISGISGLEFDDDARSAALVDWDGDGRLDVWLSNRTSPRVRLMRNVIPPAGNFMDLQLVGRTCNRDAIGARVEVYVKGALKPQLYTLRGGEGYIAQSAKWIHVGMDPAAEVERVVVLWPGGKPENFTGLQIGHRHRIVQGAGKAEVLPVPSRTLAWAPSPAPRIPVSERVRIVAPTRPPLPPLTYTDPKGKEQKVLDGSKRPVLVNLWASWCPNCVAELRDWSQRADALKKAGVRVLAVSVDDDDTKKQQAKNLIEQFSWPFEWGFAATRFGDVVDAIQQVLLERDRPLPLPSSLLVDAEGKITVFYKGPVSMDVVVKDVALCGASPSVLREAATPFPGHWLSEPPLLMIHQYADAITGRGYPELAASLLALVGGSDDASAASARVNMAVALFQQGKFEEAETALRDYLKDNPNDGNALNNLGSVLATQGRDAEAIPVYEQSLRARPDHPDTMTNYARSLRVVGRVDDSEAALRKVLESYPEHLGALNNLASMLLTRGNVQEGAELLQRALRQDPNHVQAGLNFAMLLGNQGHVDQAMVWLKRVLRNDPGNVMALAYLGSMHRRAKRYDEAEKAYQQALTLSPKDKAALRGLGQLYVETGNLKAAEEIAQRLETIDPQQARALDAAILKARSGGEKKE